MSVKEKIVQLFIEKKELNISEIVDSLSVSKQYVHRVLLILQDANFIEKFGVAPKTIYKLVSRDGIATVSSLNLALNSSNVTATVSNITTDKLAFLDSNFLVITELGKMLTGLDAFENWCIKRKLPIEKTLDEYLLTKNKYDAYFDKNHLISGLEKLKSTKAYDKIHLDELLYLDFYAIERFGKTRLGTILHYAKQGQNKMLMKILIDEIKKPLDTIIQFYDIDAVGYVPPTIKRETQLMKVLMNGLKINKPKIEIIKISGIIPVPQKSLNKIEERISNAENTFVVQSTSSYKNLLLIDDAVGSGATLNQIAEKIKIKAIAQNIIGLAIVGSFKGFDVITDI